MLRITLKTMAHWRDSHNTSLAPRVAQHLACYFRLTFGSRLTFKADLLILVGFLLTVRQKSGLNHATSFKARRFSKPARTSFKARFALTSW